MTLAHHSHPAPERRQGTAVLVDAVVVAYRSSAFLRDCVAPLAHAPDVAVVVVDNPSGDDPATALFGLDLELVYAPRNGGFAYGCNLGARRGSAPYVLLLNPDARVDRAALGALVAALEEDPAAGLAAPRIIAFDEQLEFSQRRFPRRRSTYGQALFLHRLLPRASWTDELVRDPAAYASPASPDWVSGACMLIRREAFEQIGGMDEGYGLYCEDIDLCLRLREAGWTIAYTPAATARHLGGASGDRAEMLPLLAASRVRFAHRHASRLAAAAETAGIALGHATHAAVAIGAPVRRRGHVAALKVALGGRAPGLPAPAPATGGHVPGAHGE